MAWWGEGYSRAWGNFVEAAVKTSCHRKVLTQNNSASLVMTYIG